jgi:phage tail-like protein
MEDLPSIYQREEERYQREEERYQRGKERSGSFLRTLVGVVETTTQDLDARIAVLGHHVHPDTAEVKWLDYLARWLGVPWDDALTPEQKRSLLQRAPDLAKDRGTRAGLEALLESLIPDQPRLFRVTDATADFGFACVGGDSCAGSRLPAILAGSPRATAELDATAVLGRTWLAGRTEVDDGVSQHAGKIRVDVAATAAQRLAWEPWLAALITEMVPLATKVELNWIAAKALRTDRLDGTLTLASDPAPHLGTDTVTGQTRLPECRPSISAKGPQIGVRLS